MPPKGKSSKKVTKQSTPDSTWLSKFCRSNDIPEDVMDVLAQNQILSKSFLAAITEQDLADMGFVVGHKILLRRVISCLRQEGEDPQEVKAAVKKTEFGGGTFKTRNGVLLPYSDSGFPDGQRCYYFFCYSPSCHYFVGDPRWKHYAGR